MSAYMVSKETVDGLVLAGLIASGGGTPLVWIEGLGPDGSVSVTGLVPDTASRTGAMLWAENRASVNARYSENEMEDFYTFDVLPDKIFSPDPVKVLKLLAHYEYQACESREWGLSEAYRFTEALRAAAIAALPGMTAAPWGLNSLDDLR